MAEHDASASTQDHRRQAGARSAVCAVMTVSDTRTKADDHGGPIVMDALRGAGHEIAAYEIVPDDAGMIDAKLRAWIADPRIELICTTGGTGIASRDTTVEVVQRLLGKELTGFGELFRMLSYEQVGSAAMLSRAVAGLAEETFIFTLPGSPNAVRLAMEKLIVPELSHLLWERAR